MKSPMRPSTSPRKPSHPSRPNPAQPEPTRRHVLSWAPAVAIALGSASVGAQPRPKATALPSMTEGPFYPPAIWRQRRSSDWDADLTRVQRGAQTLVARGEHLALLATVVDTEGRLIDAADVEIWQCDALATYHHPDVRASAAQIDDGFQGFGAAVSDAAGRVSFRTIRPVSYPGRTPHIHVRLRHASFGDWTSQLFLAGEPGNERDFLWRSLRPAAREAATLQLQPAGTTDGLRWQTSARLVVPA